MDFLNYDFMQRALLAGVLASVACGIVGSYVVIKRIVFIGGGISHAAFGGVGLGILLGFNPIIGAALFAVASALGIGVISKRTKREDTAIGIIWAIGMSAGIAFIGLSDKYTPGLMGYLFGSILTVPIADLIITGLLDVVILITVAVLYKELLAVSFDEEFATIVGVPVNFVYFLLLILVALTVVVLIKVVGIILVIALLTIPAATANLYLKSLKKIMVTSVILSVIATTSGLLISFYFDIASGAAIIGVAAVIFVIVWAAKSLLSGSIRGRGKA